MRKMYCWNCKKTVKTNTVETEILSQISEDAPKGLQTITYCSGCDAILKPKPEKITCFHCGKRDKAFYWAQDVPAHAGGIDVPLCKKCRVKLMEK